VIDLSHNKLRTLNATQFDLENLTTLDLRGNRLTDATREDLARLKVELHVD
jgi:Leucine-rich repeat (LRR) protein